MAFFNALRPVAAIDPGSAIGQHHAANLPFLAKLEQGQHLRATVQGALSNGGFAVTLHSQDGQAVDEAALHMKLPAGARPGDVFNLIFVARSPRPGFALTADTPPEAEASSFPSRLSGTARFIDDLLRRSVFPDSPAALTGNTPLLAKPPDEGLELSLRLAQAVGSSGLFYESHQAQWVAGIRPFSELLMEPQAYLAKLESPTGTPDRREVNPRASAGAMDPAVAGTPPALEHAHSDLDSAPPNHWGPVHRDALAVVRQQLEVLETRHITWRGEAWPSQLITLETFEEDHGRPEERDEAGQTQAVPWVARLSLNLPSLGPVTANLRLHRHGLEVSLSSIDHAATAVLRAGTATLAHGLEGAGIKLLGMGVKVREERD
jgi:hypothetical protein